MHFGPSSSFLHTLVTQLQGPNIFKVTPERANHIISTRNKQIITYSNKNVCLRAIMSASRLLSAKWLVV